MIAFLRWTRHEREHVEARLAWLDWLQEELDEGTYASADEALDAYYSGLA